MSGLSGPVLGSHSGLAHSTIALSSIMTPTLLVTIKLACFHKYLDLKYCMYTVVPCSTWRTFRLNPCLPWATQRRRSVPTSLICQTIPTKRQYITIKSSIESVPTSRLWGHRPQVTQNRETLVFAEITVLFLKILKRHASHLSDPSGSAGLCVYNKTIMCSVDGIDGAPT